MGARDIDSELATTEAFGYIQRLEPDEIETLQWLLDEIRGRFGASDSFDHTDPKFTELVKQLATRASLKCD